MDLYNAHGGLLCMRRGGTLGLATPTQLDVHFI